MQWTGIRRKITNKQKKTIYKIKTWNVSNLQEKEKKLEEEFKEAGLEILAIIETKRK